MNVVLSKTSLAKSSCDALVFFVEQDFKFSAAMKEIAKEYYPTLEQFLKNEEFTGKAGSVATIPVVDGKKNRCIFFAGLGKKNATKALDMETYRRAIGTVLKTVQRKKFDSVALQLPDAALFDAAPEYCAQQTTTIAMMALYKFNDFFSDESLKAKTAIAVELVADKADAAAVKDGIATGIIIGKAVNNVRHWVDTPPSHLTPTILAGFAEKIAKKYALKIKVFNEQEINKMGMGGLAGVSAGSDEDCKLVIMEYTTAKKDAPTLAFVGKGITFDSGGLSIKPAVSMETMKDDMAGAASVIAVMEAVAQLKPAINLIIAAPISENMPSGKATKPGDILRFYNGKTAEVKNTDAEGRLVLADALSYVVKHYKPDAIIDIATLTGACAYALGPFHTGLMSQHDALSEKVQQSARRAGDAVWPLPMTNDYKDAIKSSIADICNIGNERIRAGAITAAFFLQHFVDDVPWVHLDIAGTAFDVPSISYYNPGATGASVRLLIDLATHWKK